MPQAVGAAIFSLAGASAAGAATVSLAGYAITGLTYATLVGYAVTVGGSIWYSSSQNAKLRNALKKSSEDQGRSVMVCDPIAYQRLVYGQVPLSGPLLFANTHGSKNEYLWVVV